MKINEDKIAPIIIDLSVAKKGELNESFLRMFGGAIKMMLRRMFGQVDMPMMVKGTESEISAFADVLGKEKRYMEAYTDLGLNNPATYKSRYKLDDAIKSFEGKTGITWPFK
tara:strand:+ start:82 stop:417 length:336 start_codon:yes stop_codon:yes gene_type:complete